MKRIFIQMLPVMAAILLATSCSKDDGGNSEFDSPIDNQQQTEAVSDAYKTITINGKLSQSSLSKVGVDGKILKFEGGDEFSVGTEGDDVIITISITDDKGSYTATLKSKDDDKLTATSGFTATHGTDPSAISEGYADLPTAVKNAYYTIDFIVVKAGETYSLKDKTETSSDIKANVKSAFVNAQSTGSITVSGNLRFIRKDNVYVLSSTATMGSSGKGITAGTIYAVKNASVAPNCLPGAFTVDASNTQVYFSKGNLQYNVKDKGWSFANPQYGYVGGANANFGGPLIDLFGWGTWLDGGTPTATSSCTWSNDAQSAIGPDWFTLTQSQWTHLFDSRTTTSGVRYAKACVDGVNGLIIVPDDWSNTGTCELKSTNNAKAAYTSNKIDATTWKDTFESAGAVFLPAAGRRDNSTLSNGGLVGIYWSSSVYNEENAYDVYFDSYSLYPASHGYNYSGYSVRLVRSLSN